MHKLAGRILAINTETATIALGLRAAALVWTCIALGVLP